MNDKGDLETTNANEELENLSRKLESGDATAQDVLSGMKTMFSEAGITRDNVPTEISTINPGVPTDEMTPEEQASLDRLRSWRNQPQQTNTNETTVVNTSNLEDGQTKCEACGSTDIALNVQTGMLRCNFCRHEQQGEAFQKSVTDIRNLRGEVIGSGATNIEASVSDVLTFKCSGCGAEVIVDTSESTQARCHWCRNTLSVNEQIPNGAVPDKVLPFATNKESAQKEIEKFVNKRQFFAHPTFKEEFMTDNVMGVYLPYMVIDANVSGRFSGLGELELRRWTETRTVGTGDKKKTVVTTYYDADRYSISRDFGMTVEGLTIESNTEKLQHGSADKTNNVINAIKPFEIDKAMKWDANYMTGYTAEKRDSNIDDLSDLVDVKIADIARHNLLDSVKQYNRGVRWQTENIDVLGKQWKAAYLPIWLYSYQHVNKSIHYVAVNGQTLKTMGSVPIDTKKLTIASLLVGLFVAVLAAFGIPAFFEDIPPMVGAIVGFLIGAIGYYALIYSKYRNKGARYEHERDADANVHNMRSSDNLSKKIRRTTKASMGGDNSRAVNYKGGN